MIAEFLWATWDVLLELAPWLLLGAAIGGLLHVLLPEDFMRRQLSGPGGVVKAVVLGVPLPLCSCGVIPVGLQLKKAGASDGAAVAFLTSTPQTGADSILVSASMLGWPFAIFKVVAAAVTGIVGGWLTNATTSPAEEFLPVLDEGESHEHHGSRVAIFLEHSLELLRSIWGWLVIGVLISAAITTFVPQQALEGLGSYGGLAAMLVTLLISVPLYVCATASVPIAAALVASGLPTGAALVFLMAGPATNVATLGAVYRTLGRKPLAIYLTTIIVGSVAAGWAFGFVLDSQTVAATHQHVTGTWWSIATAVLLLGLIGWFAIDDLRRYLRSRSIPAATTDPALELDVDGMTCSNCVAKLESTLTGDAQISSAAVRLGHATVYGEASEQRVRELVQQAGFRPI